TTNEGIHADVSEFLVEAQHPLHVDLFNAVFAFGKCTTQLIACALRSERLIPACVPVETNPTGSPQPVRDFISQGAGSDDPIADVVVNELVSCPIWILAPVVGRG